MPADIEHFRGYFRSPGINGEQRRKKLDSIHWITGDFAEALNERLDPGTFLLLSNCTPIRSCALASHIDYVRARCNVGPRQSERIIDIQRTVPAKRVIRDIDDPHDQGTSRETNLSAPGRQDHKSTSNRRRPLKHETLVYPASLASSLAASNPDPTSWGACASELINIGTPACRASSTN